MGDPVAELQAALPDVLTDPDVLRGYRRDEADFCAYGMPLAVVQAGVINADLGRAAAAQGLYYPPDPGSWETSTIGGNVATNAGGMCCVKYGVTTEYVLGLEVVLASGEVLRTGRRTAKGVAGYDLTRLFVGSE